MDKVTVVIPAFNEENTIKMVVKETEPFCDEVLVILAKKSSDRTKAILEENKIKYIIDHGKGHGEAKKCAINYLQDGIIVFMDADGSHDSKDIQRMIKPLQEDKADMVIGSRMLGGSDELHGTFSNFIRNIGSNLIQLIINYRFNVRLSDCENGFRALKVSIAKDLKLNADDFDIEQEMILKALKKKNRIKEIPAHEYERKHGKSNINLWKIGWKFVWRLFKDIW
ncbi:MAG: glycosyltransferase family 2 protein [Nanoarchaeota archaeon]